MDCWDSFDKIVCVHYAPHTMRKRTLIQELSRVGLDVNSGRFNWHTTSSSEVNELLWHAVKYERISVPATVGQFNAALAHHEVIRSALAEGAESLLILENDIRFLKAGERAREIIGKWRGTGCDLVMFDRFIWSSQLKRFDVKGEPFVEFQGRVRGGSCYVLTRVGMEQAERAFREQLLGYREWTIGDVVYDYMACRKCYSATCACVQKEFGDNLNTTACHTSQYDVYRKDEVDLSLYNL